jgi:hypothetical protein
MFFVEGVLAVLVISAFLWRTAAWKRILVGLAVLALLIAAVSFGEPGLQVATRSGAGWWQDQLWRNIVLFVLLLLGMMFRVAWDALERAGVGGWRAVRLKLTIWDFVRPALVSLIVFQGVLLIAKTQDLSWELALASFQNGFFWNTLFGRTRAAIEGEHDGQRHTQST